VIPQGITFQTCKENHENIVRQQDPVFSNSIFGLENIFFSVADVGILLVYVLESQTQTESSAALEKKNREI
jgi:hypothetical protein